MKPPSPGQHQASAITTATAHNFAAKAAGSPAPLNQTNVCSACALGSLISGGIPENYTFVGPSSCATFNARVNCVIVDSDNPTFSVTARVTCAR